jgi:hypothetical protein
LDHFTSLPIVLKPKPATVRLEVVCWSGRSKWTDSRGVLDQPADCPEAEVLKPKS